MKLKICLKILIKAIAIMLLIKLIRVKQYFIVVILKRETAQCDFISEYNVDDNGKRINKNVIDN